MKFSIRSKFSVGMFFLLIILVLSIFSSYYMNKLSKETGTILKENYLSVVYARDMSGGLTNINQEIINSFLMGKNSDSLFIKTEINTINKSLQSEKNNITEPGEGKLVSDIEIGLNDYRESVAKFLGSQQPASNVVELQKKFGVLYQQLVLLSQMNGKAIEVKTDVTKISSQDAVTQMTIIAILCFIIALFYSYSFSSYSNERFSQFYKGIKEIHANNYNQQLYFDGTDKFHEISLIFNEMIDKLNENQQKMAVTLSSDVEAATMKDIQELKVMLIRMKNIEERADEMISKLENKI